MKKTKKYSIIASVFLFAVGIGLAQFADGVQREIGQYLLIFGIGGAIIFLLPSSSLFDVFSKK